MKIKGCKRKLKKKFRKCLICGGKLGRKSVPHHYPPREISLDGKIVKVHKECHKRYHFLLKKSSLNIERIFKLINLPDPVFKNRSDFLIFLREFISNVKNDLILT